MTARKPRPLIAVPDQPALVADLGTLAEQAAEMTDGMLNCREHRRHDWRSASVIRVGRGFHRIEICSDCKSERWQDLDSRGLVTASGVRYSEGYLNPPGTGRVNQVGQGVYRLELLGRLLERAEQSKPKRRRKAAS